MLGFLRIPHCRSAQGHGRSRGTNKQTNVAQIISTSMTLTFDRIGPINLNQGSTCIHSPTFIQIGPRTAEIQKFDL